MNSNYQNFVPLKAIPFIEFLINEHSFTLKIVNQRETKHGDFRQLPDGRFQITVNNNLNKYQFLLTLVHEIAHHVTHQKFGRVQPHGKEWKMVFQHLMLPFLRPEIYPMEMLPFLARYFKNPKASTDTDADLSLALRGNVAETGKHFIFDIPFGSLFVFKNTIYKRGNKRRTRYECMNMSNKKVYLFNQNVEIEFYKNG
ncbi:SprT-like domain-containing protein [Polaribacter sp. Z014]|uniref:SprT-like domain-containing protein n=1 Tax=unclassified Polaribacter TaxID=196858 RepID=UPI00193AF266|nr:MULTISPECIES: SprT-like domain-containing protein [unclassified Polaribacter]MCL7763308.1 SprT-like domain-containing protein [Polaribacter sp. Z014]QVY67252.1 SprT-like domain-containing protein [Polaribacter sp. Q13]